MIYKARFSELHAERIQVNGVAGFVAECGGNLQTIAEDVFAFLFNLKPAEAAATLPVERRTSEVENANSASMMAIELGEFDARVKASPRTPKKRRKADADEPAPAQPAEGTIAAAICAELAKGPLTSSQINERLNKKQYVALTSVYSTCSALKSKGVLTNEIDDSDGKRKYSLAEVQK